MREWKISFSQWTSTFLPSMHSVPSSTMLHGHRHSLHGNKRHYLWYVIDCPKRCSTLLYTCEMLGMKSNELRCLHLGLYGLTGSTCISITHTKSTCSALNWHALRPCQSASSVTRLNNLAWGDFIAFVHNIAIRIKQLHETPLHFCLYQVSSCCKASSARVIHG